MGELLTSGAGQLSLAVERVTIEGSCYDPGLAALAIKQARGDLLEAIFLIRAYRTTLPRFGVTLPLDTGTMTLRRRISATFKDVPGGQILGPTFDYTHRLLDFSLAGQGDGVRADPVAPVTNGAEPEATPRVTDLLDREGLIEAQEPDGDERRVGDVTREPLSFPTERDACRISPAATRASCSRWGTRHSVGTAEIIRSRGRSVRAKWPSSSCPRNWASRSRSPRSR